MAVACSATSDPSRAVYDDEFRCVFLYHNGFNQMPDCVWECDGWITLQDAGMYWVVKESLRSRAAIGCNEGIVGSNTVRTF